MSAENRYLIAAVSRLTGLSADTIRAWERRHNIVAPSRNVAGVRLYSDDDIARLECARAAVELGHPIRRVAVMSTEELSTLVACEQSHGAPGAAASRTVNDVLKALDEYDVERAETLLKSAALLMSLTELVFGVLRPLMQAVGDRWESGRFSIAQEHLASELVRTSMGNVTRDNIVSKKRSMLFATPAGETHEFGLLFAAALAGAAGVKHYVLGRDIPATEVVRAARRMQPDIVVVATLHEARDIHTETYCNELLERLPPRCVLWLGGHASGRSILPLAARASFIASLDEFARRVLLLE